MAGIEDEPYLVVSADAATQSVGFAIDAGGSATKLVYRSRRDYRDSIPINPNIPDGKGFLRLAVLASNNIDVDNLMTFLERECDIKKDTKQKTAYCTGIFTAVLEKKMKETFGLEMNCFMEYDYMLDGLRYVSENCKLTDVVHDDDTKGIEHGDTLHGQYKIAKSMKAAGLSRGELFADSDAWKNKDSSKPTRGLQPPFILVYLGSAVSHHKVEADWSYNLIEFSPHGGRSFLSVCGIISGKNESFYEIIDQATAGNMYNVDVMSGETRGGTTEDIYGEVDKQAPFFYFGKPAVQTPDAFTKEDLLASWTNNTCWIQATYSHLVAVTHGVDKVVMIGGFCDNPLVRQHLTKFWYSRLMMSKGKKIGLYFMKKGQFLPALGAYLQKNKANDA